MELIDLDEEEDVYGEEHDEGANEEREMEFDGELQILWLY